MNTWCLQRAVAGAVLWVMERRFLSPKSRCGKGTEGGFDIQCKLSNHFIRSLYHTII